MYVLIMFDITNDKKRRKAVRLLESVGVRVQWSVFECLMTVKQVNRLKDKLGKIIASTDKVHYFPLCNKDVAARKADGTAEVMYFPQFTVS